MLKVKNAKTIELRDWDNLVEKTYGKIYSFQQQDDCKERQKVHITVPVKNPEDFENDSVPEIINGEDIMGVSFKSWLKRYPHEPLNPLDEQLEDSGYYWGKNDEDKEEYKTSENNIRLFWTRNFYPHIDMLINDLYAKGLIEAGDYVIDIDW